MRTLPTANMLTYTGILTGSLSNGEGPCEICGVGPKGRASNLRDVKSGALPADHCQDIGGGGAGYFSLHDQGR